MLILRVSGSISNYGNTSDLQGKIATNAGVDASLVSINVEAGSVIITATIAVPAFTKATTVRDSLDRNLGNTTRASSALGIQLEEDFTTMIHAPPPRPPSIPPPSPPSESTTDLVWLLVLLSCVGGCCICSLLLLALARSRRPRRQPPKDIAAQQRELMAAAAVALRSARDIVAASRDDTPSPLPVLQRFASTLRALSRPPSCFPSRTVADQRWLDHNGRHFAATRHEPAGQEGSRATFACRTDGSQLPLTNADLAPTSSPPTAREQAMEWLSEALAQLPTHDTTPAKPSVNNSQSTTEFGVNSEFHPVSRDTVEQSGSDLAAQSDEPYGMTISLQEQRKSKRAFPTLGFRLVWNDAPNMGSQDANRTYGKYKKVRTLGKGSFGTAVLLRHRRTGHLVVSKQVRVQEMPRAELAKVERNSN